MGVIPALDPLEHGQLRLRLGPKASAIEQFALRMARKLSAIYWQP